MISTTRIRIQTFEIMSATALQLSQRNSPNSPRPIKFGFAVFARAPRLSDNGRMWLLATVMFFAAAQGFSALHERSKDLLMLLERLQGFDCTEPYLSATGPQPFSQIRNAIYLHEPDRCQAPESLRREAVVFGRSQEPFRMQSVLVLLPDDRIDFPNFEAQYFATSPHLLGRPAFWGAHWYNELQLGLSAGRDLRFGADLHPGFAGIWDRYENLLGRWYFQSWNLNIGYGAFDLMYGRIPFYFGEARHGNIVFSDTAKPMTGLKLRASPGNLGSLGLLQFTGFFYEQENETGAVGSHLLGLSMEWRPIRQIQIAAMQFFQFGGQGVTPLSFVDAVAMFFHANDPAVDSGFREWYAFSVGVWPVRWVHLYSEFLVDGREDLSTGGGLVLGAHFPDVKIGELRVEYAFTGANAYKDSVFTQGLTTGWTSLGHPVGPGGDSLSVGLDLPRFDSVQIGMRASYELRTLSGPEREIRLTGLLNGKYHFGASTCLLGLGYSQTSNAGGNSGTDQSSFAVTAGYIYSL